MLTINNLSAKIYRHRAAIIATETQVTDSGWFVLGPCGQEFERQFAAYLGAKHCIGVANGTDALELGLRAMGIQKGSKVATVAGNAVMTKNASGTVTNVDSIVAIPQIELYDNVYSYDSNYALGWQ